MKPARFSTYLLLLTLAGCYKNTDPTATRVAKCPPTIINQVVSSGGGQLSNLIRHELSYADNQLTKLLLTQGTTTQTFQTTYVAGRLTQASDGTTTFSYMGGMLAGRPGRIVVGRGGAEQAAYAFTYDPRGRLTTLRETRTVIPPDWYVAARDYTFFYNATGDLISEKGVNTLSDGAVISQTTAYTVSTTPAPLADMTEPALLNALALYYRLDALPARYWQPTSPTRYETTSMGATNTPTVATRAVLTPRLGANQRIDSQEVVVSNYPAGSQFPQDRTLVQTFSYGCF